MFDNFHQNVHHSSLVLHRFALNRRQYWIVCHCRRQIQWKIGVSSVVHPRAVKWEYVRRCQLTIEKSQKSENYHEKEEETGTNGLGGNILRNCMKTTTMTMTTMRFEANDNELRIDERWSGKFYVLLVMKTLHHAIQITIHNVDFQYCWFISGKIKIMSNFLHHYFRHLPLASLLLEICFNFFSIQCRRVLAFVSWVERTRRGSEPSWRGGRDELLVVCVGMDAMEGNQVWINHWTLKFHFLASSASRFSASMGDVYMMSEVCI